GFVGSSDRGVVRFAPDVASRTRNRADGAGRRRGKRGQPVEQTAIRAKDNFTPHRHLSFIYGLADRSVAWYQIAPIAAWTNGWRRGPAELGPGLGKQSSLH